MKEPLTSRPFIWSDVGALRDMIARRNAHEDPRDQMYIGDFFWSLRTTREGDVLGDLRVWHDGGGAMQAFTWLDAPLSGDTIVAHDAAGSTLFLAIEWLEETQRRYGEHVLSIVAPAHDRQRIDTLEQRGYKQGGGGNVRFWRTIETAPRASALPDGFSIAPVTTAHDVEQRVFVEMNSFASVGLTADAWRSVADRLPNYRRELDLLAIAPAGGGASACTCWYDEESRSGEFEAVGTAQAYRQRGVGKAVITEGLRRLHALGATHAIVYTTIGNTPAIALYRSCGFEFVAEDHSWTRSL